MQNWKELSKDVTFREYVQRFPLTCVHLPRFQLPKVCRSLKILSEKFQNEAIHRFSAVGLVSSARPSAHVQCPHLAARLQQLRQRSGP